MGWLKGAPRSRPALPFDKILADVRALYPEACRVFIAGSYARDEMHTYSDVDIVIELPHAVNRDDRWLWRKWNRWRYSRKRRDLTVREADKRYGRGLTVDFIRHVIGGPHVGQHDYRVGEGLPTPEITLWKAV